MQVPGIAQAVVDKYEPEPGSVELAAYFTLVPGTEDFDLDEMVASLKSGVPSYMVPAYFIELEKIPLLASHKADRKSLPKPTGSRYAARQGSRRAAGRPRGGSRGRARQGAGPRDGVGDRQFLLRPRRQLAADGAVRERSCATSRRQPACRCAIFIQNPTVRQVAALAGAAKTEVPAPVHRRLGTAQGKHLGLCRDRRCADGRTGQLFASRHGGAAGGGRVGRAGKQPGRPLRSGDAGGHGLRRDLFTLLPVALKWLLIGRFNAGRIPAWGFAYFRFWAVKQLIRRNPISLFVGSPIYTVYLRLLGARIGRNVTIHSASIPVATDLISIGEGTVILKDAMFNAYPRPRRPHRNRCRDDRRPGFRVRGDGARYR